MKRFFIAFMLMPVQFAFAQEGIVFQEDTSFSQLLAQAKKEKKLIFIDAFAVWCGPCKAMAKNIFPQKDVADYFNANFINAKYDMEKGEGRELAQKYSIFSYPTLLFLNADGEVVSKNLGYTEAPNLLSTAHLANNPNNRKGSIKERFAAGESDPEFLMNIVRTNANSDYDFAKLASERYFQKRKAAPLTKDEVSALLYFIKSDKDPNYLVFKNNKSQISPLLPDQMYQQLDAQYQLSGLEPKVIDANNQQINDQLFLSEANKLVGAEESQKALDRLKMNYYLSVKKYNDFAEAAVDYYKNPDTADANELAKTSAVFADFVTRQDLLQKSLEWAQKSVMRGENEQNTLVLAKIFLKLGDKANAKSFAEMSRNMSRQTGRPSPAAEDFLTKIVP